MNMESDHSKLHRFLQHRHVPYLTPLEKMLMRFSSGERVILYVLGILLAVSTFFLFVGASRALSIQVPARGGSITEGIVGPARFINPLIALSQPDRDLSALVYSGLTRTLPDGSIVADLASSYEISEDGTMYTFHLRPDATFQDGTPVLAADVVFTIQKAKDPEIKSPLRADWDGVSMSTPDSHTIVFTLPHPYAPFIESTSVGILPKHLWENVSAQEFPFSSYNTHPIGTGPYKVVSVDTDPTGVPTRYELTPFTKFALGEAFIKKITIQSYANEDQLASAYKDGRIESLAGISPSNMDVFSTNKSRLARVALPRSFGIFLNQSRNPELADQSVRNALNAAIDKDALVDTALEGFGVPLDGPIPPGILDHTPPATPEHFTSTQTHATSTTSDTAQEARAILTKGGWTFNEDTGVWSKKKDILEISLSTADEPELAATAQAVASAWRTAGIKVSVHTYPLSELNTTVIRPRAYDAVLFGEVVGRTVDLFAFWHSSQRNDPGLNVALYANSKADSLLTQARTTSDESARAKLYEQFDAIVKKDQPAVFLYAPEFIYIVPSKLKGVELGALTSPSERFSNVYRWYIDTAYVWDVFVDYQL